MVEVFSTDEKEALPEFVTVTFTRAEVIATCAQLVAVKLDDPRRPDCRAAFTKLISASRPLPPNFNTSREVENAA